MCDGQLFDLFMINTMKHNIVLDIFFKMILSLLHNILITKPKIYFTLLQQL